MPDIDPPQVADKQLQRKLDQLAEVAREDRDIAAQQTLIRGRRRTLYLEIIDGWPEEEGLLSMIARTAGVTVPAVIQVRDAARKAAAKAEAEKAEVPG